MKGKTAPPVKSSGSKGKGGGGPSNEMRKKYGRNMSRVVYQRGGSRGS